MKIKNKLSISLLIFLIAILVFPSFSVIDIAYTKTNHPQLNEIHPVAQGLDFVDLSISAEDIHVSEVSGNIGEKIFINATVSNIGTLATTFDIHLYLNSSGVITELATRIDYLENRTTKWINFTWQISSNLVRGVYGLVVELNTTGINNDVDPSNNIASQNFIVKSGEPDSELMLEMPRDYAYPGKRIRITAILTNNELEHISAVVQLYYYPANKTVANSTLIDNLSLEVDSESTVEEFIIWNIPDLDNVSYGNYIVWAEVVEPDYLGYVSSNIPLKFVQEPDTKKTPVYTQLWFIIGFIALIIFFLTIIFSLIGVIPQDRLPIQPALVVMALVIMILALFGNYFDPSVHLIGAQDIAGMVIIHPITALTAGFLVAGGLEASGAFAAAADALGRIEKLKFKGKTVFGLVGTVVILTNIPTLIAMPCGRILAAALMPAALFFGYRVAKTLGNAQMVGVVVFPFIVNAAASCGPSPLGGIGTIGEGLSKMPIGSFTTAQSTGIMIATGVCALFMRFITPMRPADLSDEDIHNEKKAKDKDASISGTESGAKDDTKAGSANNIKDEKIETKKSPPPKELYKVNK
jgi:hypothetical protein